MQKKFQKELEKSVEEELEKKMKMKHLGMQPRKSEKDDRDSKQYTANQDPVREKFFREYVGEEDKRLVRYIRKCVKLYESAKDLAPYISIVQSSGFGKTRLLQRIAEDKQNHFDNEVRLMYLCLRPFNSTGFSTTFSLTPLVDMTRMRKHLSWGLLNESLPAVSI